VYLFDSLHPASVGREILFCVIADKQMPGLSLLDNQRLDDFPEVGLGFKNILHVPVV
jgi:hypothetical protein